VNRLGARQVERGRQLDEIRLPRDILLANEAVFSRIEQIAAARAADRRVRSALAWARVAAGFAMTNPIGSLRRPRLELLLDEVAQESLRPSPGFWSGSGRRSLAATERRVLHVLSEASDIGGLTPMAERWIVRDVDSTSSVAVTRQARVARPLAQAALRSGGRTHSLGGLDILERANRLRVLGESSDFVVCHIQPDDPVAAVAFGRGYSGGAVIMLNHADHNFWLGAGPSAIIADLRPSGAELTARARRYPRSSIGYLPIPIPIAERRTLRTQAKAGLGVESTRVMLLTMARGLKYYATRLRPTFSDIIEKALNENPNVVLFAVGPETDEEPWPQLARRFGQRVRVPGRQPNPGPYLDAADVYLDTFPFSSITSLLEAATRGVPVLTLDTHEGLRRVLGAADALDDAANRGRSEEELLEMLGRLSRDENLRLARGAEAQRAVAKRYGRDSWLEHLGRLYSDAWRGHVNVDQPVGPVDDAELRHYCEALLAVELKAPLLWTCRAGERDFDRRDRLSLKGRVFKERLRRKFHVAVGHEYFERADRLLPRCATTQSGALLGGHP
jgi:Glycosyl transferases group 1